MTKITIDLNLHPEIIHRIRNAPGYVLSDIDTNVVIAEVIRSVRSLPPEPSPATFNITIRSEEGQDYVVAVKDGHTVGELKWGVASTLAKPELFEGKLVVVERTGETLVDGKKTIGELGIRDGDVLVVRARIWEGIEA